MSSLYNHAGQIWPIIDKRFSQAQINLLARNDHLVAVEVLTDGDLLVLDTGTANLEAFLDGHFGPYILTRNGRLQGVNYHYRHGHRVDVPAYPARPA